MQKILLALNIINLEGIIKEVLGVVQRNQIDSKDLAKMGLGTMFLKNTALEGFHQA